MLESGTGRDPMLCACAREVWLFAAQNCTEVVIRHKPGADLILADALSRMGHDRMAREKANTILRVRRLTRVIPDCDGVLTSTI